MGSADFGAARKIEAVHEDYEGLLNVFISAILEAQEGAKSAKFAREGFCFEAQATCEIARRLSPDYCLGAVIKKVIEAKEQEKSSRGAAIRELLGAMNYLAAAVIVMRECGAA